MIYHTHFWLVDIDRVHRSYSSIITHDEMIVEKITAVLIPEELVFCNDCWILNVASGH